MTITFYEIGLYLLALALLFITPGPVWVALIARSLKHGFSGAWPLALGVAIGDVIWPVLALLTLGQLVAVHAALLTGLKYVAVIVFMVMGSGLVVARVDRLQAPDQLTKAGFCKVCRWIAGHYRQSKGDFILHRCVARIF